MPEAKVSQVKGSMLVGFVKAIKADTSGRLEDLLTDEAKALVQERILVAKWYPFDSYKSCFQAVCKVNAQSDPEIMRLFGRKAGEETMRSIYHTVFNQSTVEGAMDAFRVIGNTVYNSFTLRSEMAGDNKIRMSIQDFDPDFMEWYLVGLGWFERTLEMVIEKNVRSQIIEKSWDGAPATVFEMSWQ